MKNFNIVLFGLIAGLLVSAKAESWLEEQLVNSVAEEFAAAPGLADTFIFFLKSKGVVQSFKEDCEKYGGSDAFGSFRSRVGEFVATAVLVTNNVSDEIDNEYGRNAEGITIFANTICYAIPAMEKSTKNLIESYKSCLEPSARVNIASDGGVLVPLLGFACENKASNILEFRNNSHSACLRNTQSEIHKCMSTTLDSAPFSPIYNAAEFLMNLITADLTLEDCQFFAKARACIYEPLRNCENRKYAKIVDSMFNIVDKNSACQSLLAEESTAEPSSANGIKVSSITGLVMTILTTLQFA